MARPNFELIETDSQLNRSKTNSWGTGEAHRFDGSFLSFEFDTELQDGVPVVSLRIYEDHGLPERKEIVSHLTAAFEAETEA